jgi:hypothetical protein
MFFRILNLTDTRFKTDSIEENNLSEKIMLISEDSKTLLPSTNYNSQLKPLGDINIKLEDIIPGINLVVILYFTILLKYYKYS